MEEHRYENDVEEYQYEYGVEEHYVKDISEFTLLDWVVVGFMGFLILAAIFFAVMNQWGFMVILVGIEIIMIHVLVIVVMNGRSAILPYFDAGAVFVILGGILMLFHNVRWNFLYLFSMGGLAWFFVGVLCLRIAHKKAKEENTFLESLMGWSGLVIGVLWIALVICAAVFCWF